MIIWQYSMQGYMDQHIYQLYYFIYDLYMWFIWPKLFPKMKILSLFTHPHVVQNPEFTRVSWRRSRRSDCIYTDF